MDLCLHYIYCVVVYLYFNDVLWFSGKCFCEANFLKTIVFHYNTIIIIHTLFSPQDQKAIGLNLSSYVVASSVGNQSISNLQDPVQIEIVHLQYQVH